MRHFVHRLIEQEVSFYFTEQSCSMKQLIHSFIHSFQWRKTSSPYYRHTKRYTKRRKTLSYSSSLSPTYFTRQLTTGQISCFTDSSILCNSTSKQNEQTMQRIVDFSDQHVKEFDTLSQYLYYKKQKLLLYNDIVDPLPRPPFSMP